MQNNKFRHHEVGFCHQLKKSDDSCNGLQTNDADILSSPSSEIDIYIDVENLSKFETDRAYFVTSVPENSRVNLCIYLETGEKRKINAQSKIDFII